MCSQNRYAFRRLGAGHCGSVWTPDSQAHIQHGDAFKREDGGPGRSLRNDFEMHRRLIEAMDQFRTITGKQPRISIPQCKEFITPEEEWWQGNLRCFPTTYMPCNTLRSERIPAFGEITREKLINEYCPASLVSEIKSSVVNRDCMIRPYLGRRRHGFRQSKLKVFSLRNFLLHVDQMEEIGIPETNMIIYAQIMAETLAIMHWLARMDANDVEFVLAPQRTGSSISGSSAAISNILGDHTIWVLDFDCCKPLSFDTEGVRQAITAFMRNDPFYPRPTSCPALWSSFRGKYLETSTRILIDTFADLPVKFINGIEAEIESRKGKDASVIGKFTRDN